MIFVTLFLNCLICILKINDRKREEALNQISAFSDIVQLGVKKDRTDEKSVTACFRESRIYSTASVTESKD